MISVVIPSYNHAPYIGEAIDSVLKQTCQQFEIIIIDDGSTDGTKAVLSRYEDDERIKIFFQENNGAAFSINRGVEKAEGEYLAILNSDDVYHPERFEILIGLMESQAEKDLVLFSGLSFIDGQSKPVGQVSRTEFYYEWLAFYHEQHPRNHFIHGNLLTTTSNLFLARKTFAKIGKFVNLRYCHDWEWVLRASKFARFIFVEQPLLCYRTHESNTITEPDLPRHCLENAYVFSSLVNAKGRNNDEQAVFEEIGLFAKARFLYPFPIVILLYLRFNLGDERTLELINNNELALYLTGLWDEYGTIREAFYSLPQIKGVVDFLQAALGRQRDELQRSNEQLHKCFADIKQGQQQISLLIAESTRQAEAIFNLKEIVARQEHALHAQENILRTQEDYLRILEESLIYRVRLRFEQVAQGLRRLIRKPGIFFGSGRKRISSNLGSGVRYLFQIETPGFDQQRRCVLNDGGEEILIISGWFADMAKIQGVDVVLITGNGVEFCAETRLLRPDVGRCFKALGFTRCGFSVKIPFARGEETVMFRLGLVTKTGKIFSDEQFEVFASSTNKSTPPVCVPSCPSERD